MKFCADDSSDKRIEFASNYLEENGFIKVDKNENADFVLLGVNPDKKLLNSSSLIFAGNVEMPNVIDYTKDEAFALKNAYYTAEAAVSLAIYETDKALSDSSILILGYGRIGKALEAYLRPLSKDITVCARDENARIKASFNGSKTVDFSDIANGLYYDIIFNTVPHPVLNSKELSNAKEGLIIIDLASFPGGVDAHFARAKNIRLITARGLPGKFSPASAGKAVGETVIKILKEVNP